MPSDSDNLEAIKATTLSKFEWNPVDAFVEHLKEIDDPRVAQTTSESQAQQAGEALHDKSFGLFVSVKQEDTGDTILEKMRAERVTAINHNDYQIQGAPDHVIVEGDTVRVEDMKTTSWDDKDFWKQHQLPQAAFQVRIYSWMLSHVPNITVQNPQIAVKQRKDGSSVDWFTYEVEYEQEDTEGHINYVLSMLEQPTELAPLRPEEDWKNEYWDEFIKLALSDKNNKP